MTLTSPIRDELIEIVARGLARQRVIDNTKGQGDKDEEFVNRAVEYGWKQFIQDAATAIDTLQANGYTISKTGGPF